MTCWYKQIIRSGSVYEQIYFAGYPVKNLQNAKPKPPPARNEEERFAYNQAKSLREFVRLVNTNFGPWDSYVTLTCSDEMLPATFADARKVLENYKRRLQYLFPKMKMVAVMGRGHRTGRIHYHAIISGVPKSIILDKWTHGTIYRIEQLREHNTYERIDHAQDYTSLATYLFNHWTPEQGGNHYMGTRGTLAKPDKGKPKISKRIHTVEKPPQAPKGYALVEAKSTPYGYHYFKYVLLPGEKPQRHERC